jgi:hypothetical protein
MSCASVVNPGLEVRSCGNAVLLTPLNNRITVLRYNNMLLLCYIVKHLFYIPAVLVIWRRTAGQIGAFTCAARTVQTGE